MFSDDVLTFNSVINYLTFILSMSKVGGHNHLPLLTNTHAFQALIQPLDDLCLTQHCLCRSAQVITVESIVTAVNLNNFNAAFSIMPQLVSILNTY